MTFIRKSRVQLTLAFLLCLALLGSSANAALAKSFKSCREVNKTFPNGVALNQVSAGLLMADIRPAIYRANKRLDNDKDGIICEDEVLQAYLSAPTTTTSTTTSTTTIPAPPAPPSGLTLTIKTPFDGSGVLTWVDNSTNEDNFYVSNVDPSTLAGAPLSSIWYKASRNQNVVNITGFQNGYTYCYWVMASNSIGNSQWSTSVCSLAGTATTTTSTTLYVPAFGGGRSSSANWLGCYFKGQRMWGSVYITSYSSLADFRVYQSSYSSLADLRVYNSSYSSLATSCGIWYITSYASLADFTIYLTPYSSLADFSIYVTSYASLAGR